MNLEIRTTARNWTIAIVIALVLQAYVFYHARHYGLLQGLLSKDDVYTIARALEQLDILMQSHYPAGLIHRLVRFIHPVLFVHNPLSDTQTMIGLLVTGGNILAPFALNFWCLALVLYAISSRALKINTLLLAALILFVVAQPLTLMTLMSLKADFKGGLLIAAAILFLNEAVERRDRKLKIAGAALLGLSLLSKLFAFYLPVLALGILVLFEIYGVIKERARSPSRAASGLWSAPREAFAAWRSSNVGLFVLCVVLAIGPYVLFFARDLGGYATYIRFALSPVWDDGLSHLERAFYYSPFSNDGSTVWGTLPIFLLVFAAACVVVSIVRRDYAYPILLSMLALTAGAFAAPLVLSRGSVIEFSGPLLGVVMGATLVSIRTFDRMLPRWGAGMALGISITLALLTRLPLEFNPPSHGGATPSHDFSKSELQQLDATYSRIVTIMEEHAVSDRPRVAVFYDHTTALPPNLTIKYFQNTGHFLAMLPVWDLSNAATLESTLAEADFALTIVPLPGATAVLGMNPIFPISEDPQRGDKCVSALGTFERIETFPAPGGEFRLYRARTAERRPIPEKVPC